MRVINGFNRIARYYDPLKRLVFGTAIHRSQVAFLNDIPPAGKVLILGGGSGEILKPLLQRSPECRIWFVEASSEMLSRAINSAPGGSLENIHFVHGTESMLPPGIVFDGVITHFFLDLFPDPEVGSICGNLSKNLETDAVWLVTDFVDQGKWWQKVLLAIMYKFFILTCGIQARKLPVWQAQLRMAGLEEKASKSFYGGFIKSCVYKKVTAGFGGSI